MKNILKSLYKDKDPKEEYLRKHGGTHSCPQCNKWEHEGNTIYRGCGYD